MFEEELPLFDNFNRLTREFTFLSKESLQRINEECPEFKECLAEIIIEANKLGKEGHLIENIKLNSSEKKLKFIMQYGTST